MEIVLLALAIITLVFAHCLKVYRQKQFIEIYERPNDKSLLQALSFGYIINFILPFRLGDLFRAWYAGRKMKNGLSFSLSTVVVDRILDVFIVAILFLLFYIFGFKNDVIESSILFYTVGGFALLLIIVIGLKYSRFIKLFIKKVAGIFNSDIELKILKFSWYIITSIKDLILSLNRMKLILSTMFMWIMYLLSYGLFAYSMKLMGNEVSLVDVFTSLFSRNNLDSSTLNLFFLDVDNYIIFIYLFVPLIILLAVSFLPSIKISNEKKEEKHQYLELLPHINSSDKLIFLEGYFSAKSREYFKNYIKLNRDISIIQDYSAGSNATTMLCTDGTKTFFRKYSFGKDSDKLYEQILWLQQHKGDLPLTEVMNIKRGDGYCSYDMPYIKEAIGCFNYVHSVPIVNGWNTIESALDSLNDKLYKRNSRKADIITIDKYIESKVFNNIKKIENGQYIKPLLKYDYLIINGKKYHNLEYFKKYFTKEYLEDVFKNDCYSDIHGDLTIENIICINGKSKNNFYIIDPNTGNLHDSPNLDYAKLLQSLHGGYEFLMNTKSVEINKNNINYLFTKSLIYDELYKKYCDYLNKKFDKEKVKSIFFHEIIHWFRLMPYKIEKNGQRSVLFYAGLIIVMNDVIKEFDK